MTTRIAAHALMIALGVVTVHQEVFAAPGFGAATQAAPATAPRAVPVSQAAPAPQGGPAPQPGAAAQPRPDPQASPAAEAHAAPARPVAEVRHRNVSIEVTISDQTGSDQPVKKIVTMIVADGLMGRVRSSGTVMVTMGAATIQRPVILNVDATPILHADGSVRLSVTLQYQPTADGDPAADSSVQLNESLTVTLEPGKPLVISRATDAAGRRKVAVEVSATVLK